MSFVCTALEYSSRNHLCCVPAVPTSQECAAKVRSVLPPRLLTAAVTQGPLGPGGGPAGATSGSAGVTSGGDADRVVSAMDGGRAGRPAAGAAGGPDTNRVSVAAVSATNGDGDQHQQATLPEGDGEAEPAASPRGRRGGRRGAGKRV
jgi:hypothetical protein